MKKRLLNFFTLLVLLVGFGIIATSCSSSSDDGGAPPTPSLTLNPTSISLTAQLGASSTFVISTNSTWTIVCTAPWLNLSSKSGNSGSSTITVTAIEENRTGETRNATILVNSGSESKTILVEQLSDVKGVKMSITEVLTLTTSAAYKLSMTGDVSYYYFGYLSANAAGWPDDRILEELQKGQAHKPSSTTVYGIEDLLPNTEYYLCTVAFDSSGKRGPVDKKIIKTKANISNRAMILYGSLSYTATRWEWSTKMGAFASKYYMIAASGDYAVDLIMYSNAIVAWIMKEGIDDRSLSPIMQNGDWNRSKNATDEFFYSAAWAVDDSGVFAPDIDEAANTTISLAKSINAQEKKTEISSEVIQQIKSSCFFK